MHPRQRLTLHGNGGPPTMGRDEYIRRAGAVAIREAEALLTALVDKAIEQDEEVYRVSKERVVVFASELAGRFMAALTDPWALVQSVEDPGPDGPA